MKDAKSCPICKVADRKKLGEKDSFEVFRCKNCQSVYTENAKESLGSFNYSDYYCENNLAIPEFIFRSYKSIVSDFESFRLNNRLLDFGCGAGALLDTAKEMNWDAEGIEISSSAVEHLRKHNLKVFEGTLADAKYPDSYFDVITASEVIEHIDNPGETLQEIARILRPKGLLWMTTPHANGLSIKLLGSKWSVVCPPEHLHLFFETRRSKPCTFSARLSVIFRKVYA